MAARARATAVPDGAPSSKDSDTSRERVTETSALQPSALKEHDNQKATSLQLTLNLVCAGLGTGIYTLPWSTAGASIIPAVVIIGGVLALNAWTIAILVEAGERHNTYDIGALLGRLPGVGRIAQASCNVVLFATMFLVLVGYIITIVDSLYVIPSLAHRPRLHLVLIASAIVLPICFLDQRYLSATSAITVAVNINIFILIATVFGNEDFEGTSPTTCGFGLSTGLIAMLSAMMQTVTIQMCALPMYEEMEHRNAARFNRVVAVSFTTLFVLFAAFSVVGYLAFGDEVRSNVLLNLPSTPWGVATRIVAIAAVVGVYPIILTPMIAPLEHLNSITHQRRSATVLVSKVVIVLAVMFAAVGVKDLGYVNILNGAVSLGVFVALAPALVGLYLVEQKERPSWRLAMYTLLVVGVVFAVLGLILTDNYFKQLEASCVWFSSGHGLLSANRASP